MNEYKRPPQTTSRPPIESPETEDYAPAIESLSDKWRDIQATTTPSQADKRNITLWGIGIGIALVIFLALVGGFFLLVWTVNR